MFNFDCKKAIKTDSSPEYIDYLYDVTDYMTELMGDIVDFAELYLGDVYPESSEDSQLCSLERINEKACFVDRKFEEQLTIKLEDEFHLRVKLKNGKVFIFNGCEFGSVSV